MKEGKRQKQVSALLLEELNRIFQKLGLNMVQGGMVSISSVKITPDLYEARVYLSFYQVKDASEALKLIADRAWEIKRDLVSSIRNQLRSMPQLTFYIDDSLDYVDKMDALFREINANKSPESGQP
ncbi:MAG: 30S ribosome-binding factor RbfA [Bacteroidota bacterium]|nr:30S ribosome-binding factor RbfA [Bacteroidota bacterium]MDP4211574.1 30S ribosome-binding factor RbfA [Bacteroidota bacterium]MDP4249119.1 30S ribosome-binding factor RbfA [Bacteroidota bacterium]